MEKEIACGRGKYFVTDCGDVYSTQRGGKRKMSPFLRSGYPSIEIVFRGDDYFRKTFKVHVLVWEAFNGEKPEGYVIDHIDGDKQNNSIDNLRLVTQSENLSARSTWSRKKLECTSPDGVTTITNTQAEAARLIGCNPKTLSDYLKKDDVYSNTIKGWTVTTWEDKNS